MRLHVRLQRHRIPTVRLTNRCKMERKSCRYTDDCAVPLFHLGLKIRQYSPDSKLTRFMRHTSPLGEGTARKRHKWRLERHKEGGMWGIRLSSLMLTRARWYPSQRYHPSETHRGARACSLHCDRRSARVPAQREHPRAPCHKCKKWPAGVHGACRP